MFADVITMEGNLLGGWGKIASTKAQLVATKVVLWGTHLCKISRFKTMATKVFTAL